MRPRGLVIAADVLAALVLPALAAGRVITEPKIVNLDSDPDLEQVIPQEVCTTFAGSAGASACAPDQFSCEPQQRLEALRGEELRLRETYVDRNDPLCCPSVERITYFGYSAGKDLYVRFRTHVERIRK